MLELIIATLAVFGIWEAFVSTFPWTVPPWLQPLLVTAGSVAWCWPDWHLGIAVMGAVAILHVRIFAGLQTASPQQISVRRPQSWVPDLP